MYELDIQVKNITISQTFFFLVLLPKLTPQNKDKEKKRKLQTKALETWALHKRGRGKMLFCTLGGIKELCMRTV